MLIGTIPAGPAPANFSSLPRVTTGSYIGNQVAPSNLSSYIYTRYRLLRTVTNM
jgi:hypothetical protein